MRLSWLATLFARNKPRSQSSTTSGSATRSYRAESGATMRSPVAVTPKPRIPVDFRRVPAATIEPRPAIPEIPVKPPAPRDDEIVRTTKMEPKEEISIQVSEGLKGLSSLLASIDDKLVAQQRAAELAAERLATLPRVLEGLVDAERTRLETLREVRSALEKQADAADRATGKLGELPALVGGISAHIGKQTESAASVRTSVESVGQSVRGLVEGAQRTQASLISEFRRGQDEQRQRFDELLARQRRVFYVVALLGLAVVVGLVIIATRLAK